MGLHSVMQKGAGRVRSITLKANGTVEVEAKGAVPRLQFQDMEDADKNLVGTLDITCSWEKVLAGDA